jgi:hypothetical protein
MLEFDIIHTWFCFCMEMAYSFDILLSKFKRGNQLVVLHKAVLKYVPLTVDN